VEFSAALQLRVKEPRAITATAKTAATVQATVVLAGVNADGETRFAFLQQASGDAALDRDALAFVRTRNFSKTGDSVVWGTVTIMWGDDIIAPAAPR
jgi:hypothetical protein